MGDGHLAGGRSVAGLGRSVQPVAYNYGTNVTYQDNQVYYGNQPVATADEYYQQAATLAQSAPAPTPMRTTGSRWASSPWSRKSSPTRTTSCNWPSTSRGAIAGNYSDLISGTNVPIQGAVDKKTQRVAWTVGNNKNTVGETGLYNLTQDEAPALIHIGKDKTQQWMLVRLKQPEQAERPAALPIAVVIVGTAVVISALDNPGRRRRRPFSTTTPRGTGGDSCIAVITSGLTPNCFSRMMSSG